MLATLRWSRSSAPWSGWRPGTAPRPSGARWRRCPATSSTSSAACRPWSRSGGPGPSRRPSGEITERYRAATVRTLRLAFLSSAVLELVATLSVALVAVVVGVRLAAGAPRPAHRPGRPAARPRGLLAAARWAPSSMRPPRGWRRSSGQPSSSRPTPRRHRSRPERPARAARAGLQLPRARRSRPGRRQRRDPRPRGDRRGRSVGIGKSTLLATMAGLLAPTSGGSASAAVRWQARRGAHRSPGSPSVRCSSTARSPTTSGWSTPAPTTRRCGPRCAGSRWRRRSRCSPPGWRRPWDRTASGSPPGSVLDWPGTSRPRAPSLGLPRRADRPPGRAHGTDHHGHDRRARELVLRRGGRTHRRRARPRAAHDLPDGAGPGLRRTCLFGARPPRSGAVALPLGRPPGRGRPIRSPPARSSERWRPRPAWP